MATTPQVVPRIGMQVMLRGPYDRPVLGVIVLVLDPSTTSRTLGCNIFVYPQWSDALDEKGHPWDKDLHHGVWENVAYGHEPGEWVPLAEYYAFHPLHSSSGVASRSESIRDNDRDPTNSGE